MASVNPEAGAGHYVSDAALFPQYSLPSMIHEGNQIQLFSPCVLFSLCIASFIGIFTVGCLHKLF